MSWDNNSKNKPKRSWSSPQEDVKNYSFVKNVTSRMTSLLPATITKWFSNASSPNTNGSAPIDTTDSSSDDETIEFPVVVQSPPKKMRFYSPTKDEVNMSNKPDSRPSSSTSPQSSSKNSILKEAVTTPVKSMSDDASDSGRDVVDSPERSLSKAIKRRSIFGSTYETSNISSINASKSLDNTLIDPKKPSFRPSLIGSPFYSGRTVYGGANSSYINYPNIKQRKVAVVKESSNINNTISHSAKKVMELLEQYSTPLTEARRIPQIVKSSINSSSSTQNSLPKYRTQELQVPSFADLLQLKQRSRLINTTNTSRQILASYSSTMHCSPYPSINSQRISEIEENQNQNSSKMTTKVKSKLTRLERGANNIESPMPCVDLPKGVLEIDKNKLPKFNFGITEPTQNLTPHISKIAHESSSFDVHSHTKLNFLSKDSDENTFKFSKPNVIGESTSPGAQLFAFGSPERRTEKSKDGQDKQNNVDKIQVTEGTKKWQCSDCWVFNNPDVFTCICCGGKKVIDKNKGTSIKCTICKFAESQSNKDICSNCQKNQHSVSISKTPPKLTNLENKLSLIANESEKSSPAESKWKCEDCWVSNESTSEKCVCCGGKKLCPKVSVPKDTNLDMWKNNAKTGWSCEVCLIKNKMDHDTCLACNAKKPNNTENINSNNVGNNLNSIIRTQKSQWECPNCLVRNETDKIKCICCDENKPGSEKIKTNKFNFGVSPNTSFKFGIYPVDNKVDAVKKPEINKAIDNKFEVEETNNNILSKPPTFSMTLKNIETMKSKDATDAIKEKGTSSEKTITFGVPKPTTVKISPSIFGMPQKQGFAANDKKNPIEIPKVDVNQESSQENIKLKINPFVLSSKANKDLTFPVTNNSNLETKVTTKDAVENSPICFSQPPNETAQQVPNPIIDDKNTCEEKTTSSTTLASIPTATITDEKSKSSSLPNLFGTSSNIMPFVPATQNSTTSSIMVFSKPQSTPSTTASTSTSLFQKSETSNSTTGFAKFSFGSNNQNTKPQGETPASFTFVNNKIDQSPFKTTFNMPADKNANSNFNKFSSFSGSSIGGGNVLSGSSPLNKTKLLSGNGTESSNALAGITKNTPTISAGIPTNGLSSGSALQSGSIPQTSDVREIFNSTPVQSEPNIWTANNNAPKPSTFSFGNSTPFNPTNALPTFGATTPAPSTVFGQHNNSSNQVPSIFSTPEPAQNHQTSNSIFGSSHTASNQNLGVGGFNTPNVATVPVNQAPLSVTTAGAMFNFGSTQRPNVFGFGQQGQQTQQPGVYSFGSAAPSAPQVHFNMGSGPSERTRKRAMRRITPR